MHACETARFFRISFIVIYLYKFNLGDFIIVKDYDQFNHRKRDANRITEDLTHSEDFIFFQSSRNMNICTIF